MKLRLKRTWEMPGDERSLRLLREAQRDHDVVVIDEFLGAGHDDPITEAIEIVPDAPQA